MAPLHSVDRKVGIWWTGTSVLLAGVTWHRLQRDGSRMAASQADKQKEQSPYPGRARLAAGWLSACRCGWPPSLPLSGKRERRGEVVPLLSVPLSLFPLFLSLFFSYPMSVPVVTLTDALSLPYTRIFTQCSTIYLCTHVSGYSWRLCLLHTYIQSTCVCFGVHHIQNLEPWPRPLLSIKAMPYDSEPMLS